MRFFAFFLAAVAVTAILDDDRPALSEKMVEEINSSEMGWTASLDQGSFFDGMTIGQAKILMGAWTESPSMRPPERAFEFIVDAPASFDSQTNWPDCHTISDIRDQSECGSCWAVAAAEAMSDRYCTYLGKTNPKYQSVQISAGDLMSCCGSCGMGCNGGFPGAAWNYWNQNGLPNIQCDPYPFPKCEHHIPAKNYPKCPSTPYQTPKCNTTCDTGITEKMYYGKTSYSVSGEEKYQAEVMQNGPIEVTFSVYEDFLAYKSGVYKHTTGNFLGGHAVKLVGWGVTSSGTKYWVINNSWNKDWGMNGQFWIERGVNMCGIEESGTAGAPKEF
eukprot:TRINITY_DN31648_c0_g1_i1.p1 TRINITY_DN31648_c0_g1~~TRINITY_DN31648_c0_g1_i1.p1  ORF type:complete len:331 (+),score=34.75 TRINITY_DN31648_c0_g1_i1:3-995(+)